MNIEDFLGEGETIVHTDRRLHFTDKKLVVFYGSSLEVYPYEHISWAEYERRISLLPIILGAIVLILGAVMWAVPQSLSEGFAVNLPLLSELLVVVGIAFVVIGFLSSRKALRFQLDSGGRPRAYRIRDQKAVEWFMGHFSRGSGGGA